MKKDLLQEHVEHYIDQLKNDPKTAKENKNERLERIRYYQSWTADKLTTMTKDDFLIYVSQLWAMRIWGNKQYVVDKVIEDNGFDNFKSHLSNLLWSSESVDKRWDTFRKSTKGFGPAMISELLCHTRPKDYMLWNRRAFVALDYLGVETLPRYDYQMTGKKYTELSKIARQIAHSMEAAGLPDVDLMEVDYFIWEELQVADNLSQIHKKPGETGKTVPIVDVPPDTVDFIHDEVRDKLRDIGQWLGFSGDTEKLVAAGSKVDATWESTIGNMGRIIYVFEVQTKGSIDSLVLNLLKSLNNPAVQGVVAVSDADQIDKIKKHTAAVPGFGEKLKFWNYMEVLKVHEALQSVNETINSLGLVPEGF